MRDLFLRDGKLQYYKAKPVECILSTYQIIARSNAQVPPQIPEEVPVQNPAGEIVLSADTSVPLFLRSTLGRTTCINTQQLLPADAENMISVLHPFIDAHLPGACVSVAL